MEKRINISVKIVSVIFTTLVFIGLGFNMKAQAMEIPVGVSIEGVDLEGKTKEEALQALDQKANEVNQKNVVLTFNDERFEISYSQIGLTVDKETSIDKALNIGKRGSALKRYKELTKVKNEPLDLKAEYKIDEETLKNAVVEKSKEINREPENAYPTRENGEFLIKPEKVGLTIDTDACVKSIKDCVLSEEWDRQDVVIELVAQTKPAEVTTADYGDIKDLLGTYKTQFNSSGPNRIANIEVGASKLNGTILEPGETFSFLEAVVPFTEENGYRYAGAYSGGKTIQSLGGGICQVSSTLYNAVLRSELTIVERQNHSMTVGYVPLAADATIATPSLDFKFKNDYDHAVYIDAYVEGTTIVISFYGTETRPENRTIEFVSVTEQTIAPPADVVTNDNSQPTSYQVVTQSAHTGYVASLYKRIFVDGVLQSEEFINRSTYQAQPRHVTKGTKE